jgi:peptide/nickel transport system permease protein
MTVFVIRRLLQAIIILIMISIIIFLLVRFLPGDPILLYVSQNQLTGLTDADIQNLRAEFGLDKSVPMQYVNWVTNLFRGDFGTSIYYHDSVGTLLAERLPVTAHLGVLSFIISNVVGVLGGLACALRRGGKVDALVTSIANLGISIPSFWLGILLIYVISLRLDWLPICGYTSPFEDFWLNTRQLIMPVLCLSAFSLASITRQTRSSVLEVVRQDYIRTAWSKGLRERTVVMKHTLKNGLIPVVTLGGIQLAYIFGGSVFIESVFNIPGMGRLMVSAIFAQDYPVIQSCTLVVAMTVVLINLLVDISYGWLDPRIRYG